MSVTFTLNSIPSAHPERPYTPTYIWESQKEAKAIIHLVHGVGETPLAFEGLVKWFTQEGYHVIAHDHIGHGPLAQANKRLGYFGVDSAADIMALDLRNVVQAMKKRYPGLDYFLLAHSMGSLVSRVYLNRYENVTGACFTGVVTSTAFLPILQAISKTALGIFPQESYNYRLHRAIFGGNKSVEQLAKWYPRPDGSDPEWDLEAFVLTNDAYRAIVDLIYQANKKDSLKHLRNDFPLATMSGEEDPFLGGERGLRFLSKDFKRAGLKNSRLYLFPGRQHDLLNSHNPRTIYIEIDTWFKELMQKNHA